MPGAALACACSDGRTGAQSCNTSGSGYGICDCTGPTSDGGTAGAGGYAGGAAGGVGAAGGAAGSGSAGAAGAAGQGAAGGAAGTGGAAGSAGGAGAAGGAAGIGAVLGCDVTLGWGSPAAAVFSPDGSVVALYSPGHSPELRHWPDDAQLPVAQLDFAASAVAFSPDGALFAASGPQGLSLWRVSDGTLLRQIPGLADAQQVSLSATGDVIATLGNENPSASVWRLTDPSNIVTLTGSHPPLQFVVAVPISVAVSPDGTKVALMYNGRSALATPTACIDEFATADGTTVWSIEEGPAGETDFSSNLRLLFSPDGTSLLANDYTGALDVLDPASGSLVHQFASLGAVGTPLANASIITPSLFSTDGTSLVLLAGQEGIPQLTITQSALMRMSDGTILLATPSGQPLLAAGVGPSTTNPLLTVSASGTEFDYLEFGANPTGMSVGSHQAYSFSAGYLAISADGRSVASGQSAYVASPADQPMLLWNTASAAPVQNWPSGGSGRSAFSGDMSVLFSLDGTHLIAFPLAAGGLSYDLDTGSTFNSGTIRLSPSGTMIGLPGPQYTAQLRRALDGALLYSLWDTQGHTGTVNAIAFSPDGTSIATASADKRIRLWDTTTGTGGAFLSGAVAGVERLVFTPDGSGIVSGDDNGDLRLWNVAVGTTSTMTNVIGRVADLALSPDGTIAYVALGTTSTFTANGDVQRFHLPDWAPLTSMHAHAGSIVQMALSGDGARLASSGDGVVRVQCVP
jgi:WD40 repeat protein